MTQLRTSSIWKKGFLSASGLESLGFSRDDSLLWEGEEEVLSISIQEDTTG